jgi:putative protease
MSKKRKVELLAPAGLPRQSKKVELLAPAGNLEKLKYAIHYGADAVYAGVPDFSLRARINNFTQESLQEAVKFAHKNKKRIYVTLNIYAHNKHLEEIKAHLKFLKTLKIDGVIVADPGIIRLIKKYLPKVEIHLSTQANATNIEAVKFWASAGVKRIVLAREVTLDEIREIKKAVPKMELEVFVHGAMCMSYSGRCILSKWMTGRSANLGDCAQPCRWQYKKTERVLETSVVDLKDRFEIDLEEDQHGTYFFNSYDLNLIAHIQDLIDAGVDSLKIEGRAKSAYYLAIVVRAYRKVIDAVETRLIASLQGKIIKEQQEELLDLVNRGYWTGFLLGDEPPHNTEADNVKSQKKFVGEIEGVKIVNKKKLNIVRVHNEIFLTDKIEVVDVDKNFAVKIKKIYNWDMEEVAEAHGGHAKRYFVEFNKVVSEKSLLRAV